MKTSPREEAPYCPLSPGTPGERVGVRGLATRAKAMSSRKFANAWCLQKRPVFARHAVPNSPLGPLPRSTGGRGAENARLPNKNRSRRCPSSIAILSHNRRQQHGRVPRQPPVLVSVGVECTQAAIAQILARPQNLPAHLGAAQATVRARGPDASRGPGSRAAAGRLRRESNAR